MDNGLVLSVPGEGSGPTINQSLWDGDQRFGDGPNHEEADRGLAPPGQPPTTAQPAQRHAGGLNPNDPNRNPPAPNGCTSKDHIKVASLNIQGRVSTVRDFRQEKWFEIYGLMNRYKIAVLAVQETHLTDNLADSISSTFDTKLRLLYSPLPNTRNVAGIAIVINKGLLRLDNVLSNKVIPGRAILAMIPWHGDTVLKILNIYAPNDTKNNENFWAQLNEILMDHPHLKPNIMLGDFNLVEDSLDRLPCHPDDTTAVASLGELKSNTDLVDGWHCTHPDKYKYTHTHIPNASQGRIDRIYMRNTLLATATEWAISSTTIQTNHWLVSVKASIPKAPNIGKGCWQIPTYILEDADTIEEINRMGKKALDDIKANRYRRTAIANPQTIFARFKCNMTKLCQKKAKKMHPTILNKIEKLKDRLNAINNNPLVPEEDKMLESLVTKTKILELEWILFESSKVYAKTKHHVHTETICRDWIRSNRVKKPHNTIFSLHNPLKRDHTDEHNSQKMVETMKEYHEALQSIDCDPTLEPNLVKLDAILDNLHAHISPEQKNVLAQPLSWPNIHIALSDLGNDKAAGLNGIPMELWKKMSALFDTNSEATVNPYCDIVEMLVRIFKDIKEHRICESTKFNEGWMCPIYKKGKRNNATNYRPITVLNMDYKIMTKALTNKLAKVAPSIIHRDQVGFLKGRSIYDQVKLAKLVIDYGRIMEKNGAIVTLDQEKAYNKILHPYLWKVLEKFNFPQRFIKTVKYLYHNASTSVMINGMISTFYLVS